MSWIVIYWRSPVLFPVPPVPNPPLCSHMWCETTLRPTQFDQVKETKLINRTGWLAGWLEGGFLPVGRDSTTLGLVILLFFFFYLSLLLSLGWNESGGGNCRAESYYILLNLRIKKRSIIIICRHKKGGMGVVNGQLCLRNKTREIETKQHHNEGSPPDAVVATTEEIE